MVQASIEQIINDPRYHDFFSLVKTARNGAVYGTKVRFPHALVLVYALNDHYDRNEANVKFYNRMIFLFRSGTYVELL